MGTCQCRTDWSSLFFFALLCFEGLFWNETPWQMKSCEARHEQDIWNVQTHCERAKVWVFFNHSWLTLAGSSCNWLQRCIRNPITHFGKPEDCVRVWSGLVLEVAVMIGWHERSCSSLSSLRSTFKLCECNSIQTTLCLSCAKGERALSTGQCNENCTSYDEELCLSRSQFPL